MITNQMQLGFSALSQNEGFARGVACAFASQLDPTLDELSDIRTAVSEAVTNAIIHGYDGAEGMVYMRCSLCGQLITISVHDDGCGIEDIAKAREPFFTTRPDMDRSGMGFTVMESFMDSLVVESEPGRGTTVTMTKLIGEAHA